MTFLIHQTLLICFVISLAAAYFEVDVQSIDQTSDDNIVDMTKLKIRKDKASKTRKVYGNMSIKVDMDNSYTESVLLFKKQGGEYRKMPYRLPAKGMCDLFNEDEYIYPELAAHSDFQLPSPCPIPAGNYEWRGFQPSLKNIPNVIMPTGDYAIEVIGIKDGEVGFKARFYLSIINL